MTCKIVRRQVLRRVAESEAAACFLQPSPSRVGLDGLGLKCLVSPGADTDVARRSLLAAIVIAGRTRGAWRNASALEDRARISSQQFLQPRSDRRAFLDCE